MALIRVEGEEQVHQPVEGVEHHLLEQEDHHPLEEGEQENDPNLLERERYEYHKEVSNTKFVSCNQ